MRRIPAAAPLKKDIRHAWERFIATGKVPPGVIRKEVLASWRRCRELGLDPYTQTISAAFAEDEKGRILKDNAALIATARPFLMGIFELVRNLDGVSFLTDQDGFILDALGAGLSWEFCQIKNAVVGSSLNERYTGTSSVVIALHEDKPFQMMPGEQYLESNHIATCAAAPIHDETGHIIGCLTITGPDGMQEKLPHALAIVTTVAHAIESQLGLKKRSYSLIAGEHLKTAMGMMSSGLIILDREHRVTNINPAAEGIIGHTLDEVVGHDLRHFFRHAEILSALEHMRELHEEELFLQEFKGTPRCIVSIKSILDQNGRFIGNVLHLREVHAIKKMVGKMAGSQGRYTFDDIQGRSPQIQQVINLARTIALSPSTVLIYGESGTGKEMLAQAIHNASDRSQGPFFALNCAAIPHDLIESELFGYEAGTFTGAVRGGRCGKLELAEGGTLFLDEVNGMSLHMQAKLLRVLEEKEFLRLGGSRYIPLDARIIVATNKDLLEEVGAGTFRGDLYYRLNVLELSIPPLRDRTGDIELLAHLFIQIVSRTLDKHIQGITPDALEFLKRRAWRGNVRELKNWVERAVNLARGPLLTREDFPAEPDRIDTNQPQDAVAPSLALASLPQVERQTILRVLEECRGNITEACRRLGIGRTTLYRKLKKYHLLISRTDVVQ
ncbi:MAG: sigma 54-interacting transcriptional regulator [Syntrophaceae bacterium]